MTRKTAFFEGLSWFKLNNLGPALGTDLKFYTSVAKGLKLKVRRFAEVTEKKLVGEPFCYPTSKKNGMNPLGILSVPQNI